MQLARLSQISWPSPGTKAVTLTPPAQPPTSVSAATLQVNLSQALRVIPRPLPLDPVAPHGPIHFPGTKIVPLNRAVVTTPATVVGKLSDVVADGRDETEILNLAQRAGLSSDEINHLKQILDSSPDFKDDAKMLLAALREDDPLLAILGKGGPNADRALRTFMDLDQMRRAHPDRITPDVMNSLVTGVAHAKSVTKVDESEGVLGEDAADRAAQALIAMPQVDYNAIHDTLQHAGGDVYSDAETERALILKAVSARGGSYKHPTINDSIVRPETLEIETFANRIRGMNRDDLVARTTVTAPDDTLQQRYEDSCSSTAAQITKAEADPIYAWSLHNEDMHSHDLGGFIGRQQAELMGQVHGMPVTDATYQQLQQIARLGGPMGAAAKAMINTLGSDLGEIENNFVSSTTGRGYDSYEVGNDVASRTAAADYIDKLVRQGVDVPIGVNWENRNALNPLQMKDNGESHALVITDVRGKGDNEVFVVADPGGATYEVSRADLIAGQNFGGSNGRLSEFLMAVISD